MTMRKRGDKGEKLFIQTINSGAFYQKGDAISDSHCVEIKTTHKKSFSINTKLLNKIWNEALDQAKFPLFGIVLRDEKDDWILKVDIVRRRK